MWKKVSCYIFDISGIDFFAAVVNGAIVSTGSYLIDSAIDGIGWTGGCSIIGNIMDIDINVVFTMVTSL